MLLPDKSCPAPNSCYELPAAVFLLSILFHFSQLFVWILSFPYAASKHTTVSQDIISASLRNFIVFDCRALLSSTPSSMSDISPRASVALDKHSISFKYLSYTYAGTLQESLHFAVIPVSEKCLVMYLLPVFLLFNGYGKTTGSSFYCRPNFFKYFIA